MKFAFALLALFALVQFSSSAFVGNRPKAGNIKTVPLEETCTAAGYFPDPDDCAKYYECAALGGGWIITHYTCAPGTVFNPAIGNCDWPFNVPGCEDYYNP